MKNNLFISKFMWASVLLLATCLVFREMTAGASPNPAHSLLFRVAMAVGCLAFGFIIALIDTIILNKQGAKGQRTKS